MKAKRMLCLLLTALMMLSMLGSFAFGASAAVAADSVSLPDDMVFVSLSWTPANLPEDITVGGKTYDLFWGKNAFGNAQTAVDAAPEYGTVYMCAGGFNTTITVKKSLTLLGAKYGIDPNVKGEKESDLWTLNPERGSGETKLEATINLGAKGNDVLADYIDVTVDGIMMVDKAMMASNNGLAGTGKLTFKNIYLKDSLQTGPSFFICPYYNAATNAYQRFVTFENIRVEGHTKGSVMKMTADHAEISGVYMAPDCTKPLFDSASASTVAGKEAVWSLHDNMFAATYSRTIYLNWYNPSSNSASLAGGVTAHTKVLNHVYNNVFVDCYRDTPVTSSDSINVTLGIRPNTENVYFNIVGNAFYHNRAPIAGHVTVSGYSSTKLDYSDQVKLTGNRFYGEVLSAFTFNQTTTYVTTSGNYFEKNGVAAAPIYAYPDSVVEEYYWKDEAMSVKSTDTEAGEGFAITATQSEKTLVSLSLPDEAVLVNPNWTAETLPETFTVRGKTFGLHWGINAFADFKEATLRARDFGTVYLCPGTYATGFETDKNLIILGANFGINPNVKGENENDLWTLNPERGEESALTGSLNLSASTSADYADVMVVDGIQLTGDGNLRSNTATLDGHVDLTLKNIYLKNTTASQPFYLHAAYPGGSAPNDFRRNVIIRDVRIEKHTGAQVMTLVADRADISGVYMHTDCTKLFLPWAAASDGPTDAAVWNIHDNMFAAPVGRGIYLNWENPKANNKPLYSGITARSAVVNNVYNNVFVNFYNKDYSSSANRSVAARFNTENVYVNLIGNAFYQNNALADGHVAFQCYSSTKKDYSDQVAVKNNKFIGNFIYDFEFNQSNAKINLDGNYACKDDVVRAPAGAADYTTYEWYYTDALMHRKSTDTTVLKAPTKVAYEMDELGTGRANGAVTVTLPAGHGAEEIYLFWGDENGKLDGYNGFAPVKVAGSKTTTRIQKGVLVPAEATHLLAYSFSAAEGMSAEYASFKLPYGAAMSEEILGDILMEFQCVSDIHVATVTSGRIHHSDHMIAMLEDVKAVSPDTVGVIANGDSVDRGTDADYNKYVETLASVKDAPDVYANFGNHETFRFDLPIPSGKTLSEYSEPFYDYMLEGALPEDTEFAYEGALSYTFKKDGYKFIFLGTDVLDQNYFELKSSTVTWLKNKLDEDRDATRPTFIFLHQNMSNTSSGVGYVRNETVLRDLFKNYPEIIMFNGHSHTSFYDPTSFYLGNASFPSVFNTSAVGYIPKTGYNKAETTVGSEGYYIYVYEDKVVVRGRDFLHNTWIPSAQYVLDLDDNAFDGTEKKVKAPYYGKSASALSTSDGKLGGAVSTYLPIDHNADNVALFLADADGEIIGTNPIATAKTAHQTGTQNVTVGLVDVEIPENADYVLAYSYSATLGWSEDCDVIALSDVPEIAEGANVSASGKVRTDKKVYKVGEPIYVTGIMEQSGDWIGMQLSSVTSGSFLNYQLSVAGSDTPVDITKQSSLSSWGKFQQVTPGDWQIGWISKDNPKQTFQTGKLAEHLITIQIVDSIEAEALGVPEVTASDAPNTTVLDNLIADARAKKSEDYTIDSFAALSETITAAEGARSGDQTAIDAAVVTLMNALNALVEKSVESIAVTTAPAKSSYHQDVDALDVTGGKVTVYYNNNTSKVIDLAKEMVSGFDNATAGALTLTVNAEGKSTTFTVTVAEHVAGELVVDTAATCMTPGIGHKDCACGKRMESDIAIPVDPDAHTGNNHVENKKDATCTEKGYTGDTVCECGKTVTEGTEIAAKGHGETEVKNAKAPTCSAEGYTGDTYCTVCDAKIADGAAIPATGKHSYDKGVVTTEPTTSKEGVKTFTCTVCGATKTEKIAKLAPKVSFKDVKKSDFYYDAVQWAVSLGVTTGTSKTEFSPAASCTRAQAVTFLWRAAGQPAPKSNKNPFTDVRSNDYYFKAVLWAAENGVTSGMTKTTFAPNATCTRGQIVTFLWRAQGAKKVSGSNPFTDVKKSDFYYNAVLWAVKNNVTAGMSKTTFAPSAKCTRGQIVTFLYRAVK